MRKVCVILLVSILTGCGSVKVMRIQNDFSTVGVKIKGSKDEYEGVRFYRPAPHVWITCIPPSDKVNIITETEGPEKAPTKQTIRTLSGKSYAATLVMLPDFSQEYIIKWKSGFFGSVQPNFALSDGWNLNSFNSVINSGVTAALSAGVIAPISTTFSFGELKEDKTSNFKGAGLYRLDYTANTDKEKPGHWELGVLVLKLEDRALPPR